MMRLSQEFHFDAAHSLTHYEDAHPNRRVHGHSFRARVSLEGAPNEHGQIVDLGLFSASLDAIRAQLDHHMLNDIIDNPTLENIAIWLWNSLEKEHPNIALVEVYRDSLGQSCSYDGQSA